MKTPHYLLFFVLSLVFNNLNAKDYYVSTDGNDSNNGSISAPFKTIQKAADEMAVGDVCHIFGGVYRETITVKKDNVTFRNYNNEKVIVSGTVKVTNWTTYQNGIYQANYTGAETQFTMLFVDFKHQQMARWPNNTTGDMMDVLNTNSGYEDCRVFEGVLGQKPRKVTFDNMPSFPDNFFAGGFFRGINGKKWWNPMGTITASQGKDLTVDALTKGWIDNTEKMLNNDGKGHGFIFHLNALDIENEWFQKDNLVYYKPPTGKDPNDMNIEVKKRKWGFRINNKSGVTLDGIQIHAASIELKNSNNCKVLNGSVQYLWPFLMRSGYGASYQALGGIYVKGNNNEFKNCYVAHSWGNGFSIESGTNNKVENCNIEDIGWISQFTSSVQNNGFNTIVTQSTFGSSGRFHIRTDNKMTITHNDLFDCMKMGQDAGSIQCTNGGNWGVPINLQGSEIAYNKIHDCTTLTNGQKQFVLAFYLEGCYNYTVHHNLVYNFITDVVPDGTFAYLGPRQTKITDCYYYNNTVWNVDWGVRIWNRDRLGDMENVRFWNNIIDGKSTDNTNGANGDLHNLIDFQNNYRSGLASNQNSIFVDADARDYRLKQNSPAIDAGREITGITTNTTGAFPDAGAIEYGSTFPVAGSNINPSAFNFTLSTSEDVIKTSASSLILYPNPAHDKLYVKGDFKQWEIFSFTGQSITKGKAEIIDVANFPKGIYVITFDKETTKKIIIN